MDPGLRSRWDASRQIGHQPFPAACYAPFVSMFFAPTGDVVACCETQATPLGNVANASLRELWNGPSFGRLRRAVAAGGLPPECSYCAWRIASGDFSGATARHFDHFPVDGDAPEWPRVMEFSLSSLCNLACIMCNPDTSSTVRALAGLPPRPAAYGDRFFAELREFLPHLHTAKFLGGEPFLAPESYRVWDMLAADGLRPHCVVTTNGTRWDARVEAALERLPMSVMFSMDGATRETLEAIRRNARFDELLRNAQRFADHCRSRGTTFRFLFSLQRRNWHELGDFLRMAEAMDVAVNLSPVVEPRECSLTALPPDELRTIADELLRQRDEVAAELHRNRELWLGAVASLAANAADASLAATTTRHRRDREDRYAALVAEGTAKRAAGDHAAAARDFAAAIALDGARPEAHLERAWLHLARRDATAGLADVDAAHAALAARPTPGLEAPLCGVHGQLAAIAGLHDAAIGAFGRLFAIEPASARAHAWRGEAWLSVGRAAEATADARAALARDPEHVHARDLLRRAEAVLGG